MKHTKVSQILNRLLVDKKIRIAELARRINLPQPTVHRIAAGICEHPHLSSLKPIADFFSITVDQLKGHDPILWLDKISKVPFLTWEQVINWPFNSNEIKGNEQIITDANVGKNGYALKINDTSMDPIFPKNTLLIADPEREVKDRSYVIAKLSSYDVAIFRQLLIDADSRYLKALSPDLERYKIAQLKNNDKILSVVVQAKRNCDE